MRVYSFNNIRSKPQRGKFGPWQKRGGLGKKVSKRSSSVDYSGTLLKSFMEHKMFSQVIAIACLTVAAFIIVQGLFGSIGGNLPVSSSEADLRVIVNYNAGETSNGANYDNSQLVMPVLEQSQEAKVDEVASNN